MYYSSRSSQIMTPEPPDDECGEGCHTETPHIDPAITRKREWIFWIRLFRIWRGHQAMKEERDEMTSQGSFLVPD
ncbi:unnamed protein product [Fusarium graminearum]|uniref:Uncharacterized protein n=1 Tax=Gibberella zeae (strain ATCC MYA-4620 / CBS 123657 / FGSC 9075 / NRRL 31084 / PH-1) TaxID=229533 RepID=A0A098DJI7_GIBZE|nr:unnamed protein product [Fusarium graminearum]